MLSRMGWIGLILCSGLFLSTDCVNAMPDRLGQSAQTALSPAPANSPASVPPPKTISEAKRSLIRQLLDITGGRHMYELMQRLLVTQMQQQVQPMITQLINNSSNLSAAEREAEVARLSANVNALTTQFSEALQTEVTYDEMLEHVYYPVYDQYYTESDLRELMAFYQTPIGQKVITVSPQLVQTSLELTNQIFTPRVAEILGRLMHQQMEQMHKPPSAHPAK